MRLQEASDEAHRIEKAKREQRSIARKVSKAQKRIEEDAAVAAVWRGEVVVAAANNLAAAALAAQLDAAASRLAVVVLKDSFKRLTSSEAPLVGAPLEDERWGDAAVMDDDERSVRVLEDFLPPWS